jgi:uncharacterized protein (DUF58 family)
MPPNPDSPRRYLDPRVLTRVASLELRARLIVEGLLTGQHRSPYQGASVEFAQHRQYVQGDDIRHVDWKVLARKDKVYLKQYQVETNLQLMLAVDASESMSFGTVRGEGGGQGGGQGGGAVGGAGGVWTKYDHATAIAAALSYLAISQQDSVGLTIFDETLVRYFRPASSSGQWRQLVNELQLVPRWNKTGTGKVLDQLAEKLTHRSLVVIVSDLFDDETAIVKALRHLRYRKHEVIVLQVLDPAEIDFPFDDVTMFKGLEEAGQLLTEPRALRAAYLEQLAAHTETLSRACRGMNIDFKRLSTAQGLEVALVQFLADRMGRQK